MGALGVVTGTQRAQFYLLTLQAGGLTLASGGGAIPAGVLLVDPEMNSLHVRLRRDWAAVAPEEAEVLEALHDDLELKCAEMGAAKLMAWLNDTLSNVLRISEPRDVVVENFDRGLRRLYRQHVEATALPYVTHLPRFTLAVAAGKFLDNEEIEAEGWEEAPVGMRLAPGMFVARIVGQSMEPRIPDGSLCVFRAGVHGSRQGRLVLVEYLGGGTNDRYTVKRYFSEKRQREDGSWTHDRIRLEPLNPEYDALDLDPEEDRHRVIAEFVEVLD
jgi:SOS-response transcriptional repressor LexA